MSVAEPVPAPKPVPKEAKPEVSLAPKVREKKSLKEQTKDPQKMIERAIDRIEKKVNEPDPGSVTAAIERLRKKLGDAEPAPARPGPEIPPPAPAARGGLPAAAEAAVAADRSDRADRHLSGDGGLSGGENWAFSQQLAGSDRNLKVGLVFKVLPNGEITDIRYTERSNNAYLDESAYKAIVKSNPVTPHPPVIRMPFVLVAIRFTPEGMR